MALIDGYYSHMYTDTLKHKMRMMITEKKRKSLVIQIGMIFYVHGVPTYYTTCCDPKHHFFYQFHSDNIHDQLFCSTRLTNVMNY